MRPKLGHVKVNGVSSIQLELSKFGYLDDYRGICKLRYLREHTEFLDVE
jgi:hypothetical protein